MKHLVLTGTASASRNIHPRERARALGRLSAALSSHNGIARALAEDLERIVADLLHPEVGVMATAAAERLSRDLLPGVEAVERMFDAALAADDVLRRALARRIDVMHTRLQRLAETGARVQSALCALTAPGLAPRPIGLIRWGLEFVAQLKRHRQWVEENVHPAVERCHRHALAQVAAGEAPTRDAGRPRTEQPAARVYALDGAPVIDAGPPSSGDTADDATRKLLAALAAHYGVRGTAPIDGPVANARRDEIPALLSA